VNLDTVTDKTFVRGMIESGCRLFFFVEYVPVQEETEAWILTPEQKQVFIRRLEEFREELPGLFVGFPGDEEEYGGCLSAGRGFVHVSTDGRIEPCPFAPFSDATFGPMTLKQALGSEFLKAIRDNHGRLKETRGGCALWAEREWVRSLLPAGPDGRVPGCRRPA
jgi:MoaA/NifB/PqqE/SkfB family radical SAM enzyme